MVESLRQSRSEGPGDGVEAPEAARPGPDGSLPADQGDENSETKSPGTEAEVEEIAATVEAILFASDSPLTPAQISRVAELPGIRGVRDAVDCLNRRYDDVGSAFRIEQVAGGYRMMTLPQYHDVLSRLLHARTETRLSQAAMETLAIVAYRQPILRADVEAVRGVASGEVLRGLLQKQLIKIVGRAEVLGRPMLYGTTKRFLEVFGLAGLKDLPKVEELRAGAGAGADGKSESTPSVEGPAGAAGTADAESVPEQSPPAAE